MNYEIHITISNCDNVEEFKSFCYNIGLTPIIIETQNKDNFLYQVMTSSKHSGSHYLYTLKYLVSNLETKYKVIRQKVELQPEQIKNENHIYYESHLRLKLPIDFNYHNLYELCNSNNFHLSKNLFKKTDEFIWQMITYRNYKIELNDFHYIINNMCKQLENLKIIYDKVEIEECVYDSNEKIDKEWLN